MPRQFIPSGPNSEGAPDPTRGPGNPGGTGDATGMAFIHGNLAGDMLCIFAL